MKRRRRTEKAQTFKPRNRFDPKRRTKMERERIFVKGFFESQGEEEEKGKGGKCPGEKNYCMRNIRGDPCGPKKRI